MPYLCALAYPKCLQKRGNESGIPYNITMPQPPCRSLCTKARDKCSKFFTWASSDALGMSQIVDKVRPLLECERILNSMVNYFPDAAHDTTHTVMCDRVDSSRYPLLHFSGALKKERVFHSKFFERGRKLALCEEGARMLMLSCFGFCDSSFHYVALSLTRRARRLQEGTDL